MTGASHVSLANDLALARRLGEVAARLSLECRLRGLATEVKSDGSLVTNADREVEQALRDVLARERPDDAVLGEEYGASGGGARCWILDPIDGTTNFAGGRPEWGNHIALEQDGVIVVGVITRPERARAWWASRGGGAYRNEHGSSGEPTRLGVSAQRELAQGRVSLWAPASDARVVRMKRRTLFTAANLDAVLRVAEGELEAVIDPSAKPWDHAPGVVIVEEAGGRYSDRFGGKRIDLGEGRFSNGLLHDPIGLLLDE